MLLEVGRWVMVAGILGGTGAQLWTAICAARDDGIAACLMCLFVPGYIILYARRYERGALWVWAGSILLVVVGVALMT